MKTIALITMTGGLLLSGPGNARTVPAWAASQQPTWGEDFIFPTNVPPRLANKTLRQVVRMGIGGHDVRIVLSNAYGTRSVNVAGVHIAPSLGSSRIEPGGDRTVQFGGATTVTIAAGATIVSDPLPIDVSVGQDLAVSLRFMTQPILESFHWDGRRTGYVLEGDQLSAPDPEVLETTTARLLLAGVLVENAEARGTVVTLGDSITDGAAVTLDAETRWPDYLAARAAHKGIAVVNAGISGARLLSDGMGSNALARFDRDVLAQPNVRTVILLLGTNDIAWPGTPFDPDGRAATLETLVAGYRAIVAKARAANVRVIGATLPPFADALPGTPLAATYYSPAKDAMRRRLNAWILTSNAFDAVVDFDGLLSDPASPGHLNPLYDSGDRLHPGDAGNKAMADAIDLDSLIGE